MTNDGDNEIVGWIIGILFIVGLAIVIARALFPLFLTLTLLCLIVLIVTLIADFRNDNLGGSDLSVSLYVLIVFLILLGGTFLTWLIGYGFGGTSFGQASLEIHSAFIGVEKTISDTIDITINEVVDSNCRVLNQENCNLLKKSVDAGKTFKEIENLAFNLKKVQGVLP